jgi:hypothetical protein
LQHRLDRRLDLRGVDPRRAPRGVELLGLREPAFARDGVEVDARRAGALQLALDERAPCASVSSCCCALNHWRTFVRARWLCT